MVEVPVKIYITNLLKTAREAARPLALLSSVTKTKALLAMADRLMADEEVILEANRQDVEAVGKTLVGETNKDTVKEAVERVRLTGEAIREMVERLREGSDQHMETAKRDGSQPGAGADRGDRDHLRCRPNGDHGGGGALLEIG